MSKFKNNNLLLKSNQKILLGNSQESEIQFDGSSLQLSSNSPTQLQYGGATVFATLSNGISIADGVTSAKLYIHDNVDLYFNNETYGGRIILTGRKLIVDSFGGYSPIGGGAQSSKDYTKVDRSGLYASRYIAKHIVASGLAKKCVVQLSYAIGVAKPTSVTVDTMGTYTSVDDDALSKFVSETFSLTPNWITKKFNLDKPSPKTFLYADVASRGQVGQSDYPWEQLDELEVFEKMKDQE